MASHAYYQPTPRGIYGIYGINPQQYLPGAVPHFNRHNLYPGSNTWTNLVSPTAGDPRAPSGPAAAAYSQVPKVASASAVAPSSSRTWTAPPAQHPAVPLSSPYPASSVPFTAAAYSGVPRLAPPSATGPPSHTWTAPAAQHPAEPPSRPSHQHIYPGPTATAYGQVPRLAPPSATGLSSHTWTAPRTDRAHSLLDPHSTPSGPPAAAYSGVPRLAPEPMAMEFGAGLDWTATQVLPRPVLHTGSHPIVRGGWHPRVGSIQRGYGVGRVSEIQAPAWLRRTPRIGAVPGVCAAPLENHVPPCVLGCGVWKPRGLRGQR